MNCAPSVPGSRAVRLTKIPIWLGLAGLHLLAACSLIPGLGVENLPLTGTPWTLTGLTGQQLPPDVTVTATFDQEGQLSGSAGCNLYSGPYTVEVNQISMGPFQLTRKACPPPVMEIEGAYLTVLQAAARHEITGNSLTLQSPSGGALAVFNGLEAGLEGTSWLATGFNNGQAAVVSVLPGTQIRATFGEDGQLSGTAGCNDYAASFETDGDQIRIGPLTSSQSTCQDPQGVMAQESQYLAALETAEVYTRRGDRLELRTSGGTLAVTFQRAPDE